MQLYGLTYLPDQGRSEAEQWAKNLYPVYPAQHFQTTNCSFPAAPCMSYLGRFSSSGIKFLLPAQSTGCLRGDSRLWEAVAEWPNTPEKGTEMSDLVSNEHCWTLCKISVSIKDLKTYSVLFIFPGSIKIPNSIKRLYFTSYAQDSYRNQTFL